MDQVFLLGNISIYSEMDCQFLIFQVIAEGETLWWLWGK